MSSRTLARIRNIGIIAHINAGKTTLTERFLYRSGKQSYLGEVDEGTATMDFMPAEQERGISISAAVTSIDWRGFHINLIDTPGHVDFTVEVERSLLVLDAVIVVIDGVAGVESQTEIVWRQAQAHGVPAIVFINKLDRTTADYEESLISVGERLACPSLPLVLPYREDGELRGLIDLIEDRVLGAVELDPSAWQLSRQAVIEACADRDESILEDFVLGRAVESARLHGALRAAVLAGEVVPVLAGSALLNRGVDLLLTAVCRYLPSPVDRTIADVDGKPVVVDVAAPFSGLTFKVQYDGDTCLYFVRIYAGALQVGQRVRGSRSPAEVRIRALFHVHAGLFEPVSEVRAGDVAAFESDAELVTGESLFTPGHPVLFEAGEFPVPVVSMRVEVFRAEDYEDMARMAQRLAREDPTLLLSEDEESGTLLVSGMGELHLQVFGQRLAATLHNRVRLSAPRVLTAQTVARSANAQAECWRHLEGEELSADVALRIEPRPGIGPGRVGTIPTDLSERVRRLLRRLLSTQLRAGLADPIPAHDVEISVLTASGDLFGARGEAVCGEALAIACRKLVGAAGSVMLEPKIEGEIACPADTLSGTLSDLRARGAEVAEVVSSGGQGRVRIVAPLAAMLGYATQLRSLTRGLGTMYLRPLGMQPVAKPG